MTPMGAANRGDRAGVARHREPIVNCSPDPAALDRWIAGPVMAGDQQDDALAPGNGPLKPAVDRLPGTVEGEAVEVEHAVRLDFSGPKAPVPACVQGASNPLRLPQGRRTLGPVGGKRQWATILTGLSCFF
jgi:hypothetical protein